MIRNIPVISPPIPLDSSPYPRPSVAKLPDSHSLIEKLQNLVEKARLGGREDMARLANVAQQRLRAYVYRIVLREDVAADIVQESMVEMDVPVRGYRLVAT